MKIDPLPTYDSLQQCSSATGIPLSTLKQAKRSGCEAFKSGRVSLGPLLKYFFSRKADEDGIDWSRELKKQQALRETNRRLREEGKLLPLDQEVEFLSSIASGARATLEQKLCNELPALVENLDAAQVRVRAKKVFDEVCEKLRALSVPRG